MNGSDALKDHFLRCALLKSGDPEVIKDVLKRTGRDTIAYGENHDVDEIVMKAMKVNASLFSMLPTQWRDDPEFRKNAILNNVLVLEHVRGHIDPETIETVIADASKDDWTRDSFVCHLVIKCSIWKVQAVLQKAHELRGILYKQLDLKL